MWRGLDHPRRYALGSAYRFRGTLRWDARERTFRSRATGAADEFEDLYLTADGRWVVHRWVRRSGARHMWFEVSALEALEWLQRCGYVSEANVLFASAKREGTIQKGGKEDEP